MHALVKHSSMLIAFDTRTQLAHMSNLNPAFKPSTQYAVHFFRITYSSNKIVKFLLPSDLYTKLMRLCCGMSLTNLLNSLFPGVLVISSYSNYNFVRFDFPETQNPFDDSSFRR